MQMSVLLKHLHFVFILDSERSEEAIGFTIMGIFIILFYYILNTFKHIPNPFIYCPHTVFHRGVTNFKRHGNEVHIIPPLLIRTSSKKNPVN